MDKKTLFAFFLIAIVLILMPYYMKLVAPQEAPVAPNDSITTTHAQRSESISPESNIYSNNINDIYERPLTPNVQRSADEQIMTVETELYSAILSNKNGGSFTSFILKK